MRSLYQNGSFYWTSYAGYDIINLTFADGAVMPSWFDIREIPITAVSYFPSIMISLSSFYECLCNIYTFRQLPHHSVKTFLSLVIYSAISINMYHTFLRCPFIVWSVGADEEGGKEVLTLYVYHIAYYSPAPHLKETLLFEY